MNYVQQVYEALKPHMVKEPMSDYNKKRKAFLSSGHLKIAGEKSLADYFAETSKTEIGGDTPAMLEGRANHILTLEGDQRYLDEFAIGGPINPATGQEYGVGTKKFSEAVMIASRSGKELVTTDINSRCVAIRESCRQHKVISDVLSEGIAEMTFRVELFGVECQVRIDWLSPKYGIVDMKTCETLSRFENEAHYKWGYFYSAAFYRSVLKALVPDLPPLPYSFLVVEKSGINKAGLFNMADDLMDKYETMNAQTIKAIAEARQTQVWPTGYENLQTIEI